MLLESFCQSDAHCVVLGDGKVGLGEERVSIAITAGVQLGVMVLWVGYALLVYRGEWRMRSALEDVVLVGGGLGGYVSPLCSVGVCVCRSALGFACRGGGMLVRGEEGSDRIGLSERSRLHIGRCSCGADI